jgi:hypothetical protein
MPRTKKTRASDAALPVIPSELIDQIVKGPMSADAVNGSVLGGNQQIDAEGAAP